MKTVAMTACSGMFTIMWSSGALAQKQGTDQTTLALRGIKYDIYGPLSPSSGTATVSPASVPQAMERLSDDGMTADFSLGAIGAGGRFGTGSKTTIRSSALAIRLRAGDWTMSASLPWMQIKSRSTIYTGIDSTPVLIAPNTSLVRQTSNGLGDLTLGASYTLAPSSSPVELQFSGRAKLNTATKTSGLSSGENDYALGVDASVPIGKITPFASFSYRFLGNTATYRLRDGPAASAGASYALSPSAFVLASYHYSRAATRLINNAHELFAGASVKLSNTPLRLTGFATAGLSQGAAAASAGVSVSIGLGRRDEPS